ncbi:hypothetical protein ES332_A09G260300v1 [Gossypium tomentosum]|uniref:CCHC-type domain-containing protein n=1 Tax=Gossypium tomentosum TaxID=34277 RepID=A0A5D2P8H6_GOSTO|nr:hypothetical protein ES332_A09G260300v1 [Gossypium tomentosum]
MDHRTKSNMENEKNVEPVTDLRLALGYSGRRIERRSSNDLGAGAGANATSRIGMTFAATDPLSEIVWSPHKGLCLKCTECSFLENKRCLVQDTAGPSNAVRSLQEIDTSARSIDEKPIDEQNINTSSLAFPILNTKVSDIDNLENDKTELCHELQTDNGNSPIGTAALVNLAGKNDPRDVGCRTQLSRSQEKNVASPAENDLQGVGDNGRVAPSKVSSSESAFEAEKISRLNKEISASKHSPTNSGICRYRRKGKEKALSDGDVKGMMSKDDSHESVESCNSIGEKKRGFEQQLIVGSKRLKKHDGSFMNWISNMMKGFSKPKDETPSLLLTTTAANTNHSHKGHIGNLDAGDKIQNPGHRNTGFQSIFHSIYSPKTKVQGTTPQSENDQAGLELTNKICNVDATPIACHGENFNFLNVFNERFKEPICGSRVGPPTRPKIALITSSPSKRSSEANIAMGVEKDRGNSSSSLGKRKMKTENIDSDPSSEAKTFRNIGYKSNLQGSLWITRFTPKASSSLLNRDTDGAVECLSDCMKPDLCPRNDVNVSNKPEEEASTGLRSFRSEDSQMIASHFVRRLDVLKQIMPSSISENRISSTVTCFFCGREGHHLQNCPEITDTEIEHLLRNMKSSNRYERLPCVCFRCFELGHWAVACPSASRVQHHSACRASSLARLEVNTELLDKNRDAIAGNATQIDTGKGPSTLYEIIADKMRSNTDVNKEYVSLSYKEIKPWGNFINQQVSDTPKAIFKAVRMLRLSRTDVLKWKNMEPSILHLKGFFLRLRLRKWEEGLGGTGYYVACIAEANSQVAQQNSNKSIVVNVGGMKCSVDSQYISNHDFLEDELTAWLLATTRTGGKLPSEEELTMKVKERRMLGL